jgi:hypothetical protein
VGARTEITATDPLRVHSDGKTSAKELSRDKVRDKWNLDAIDCCNNQIDWDCEGIWSAKSAHRSGTAQGFAEIATQESNSDVSLAGISARNNQCPEFGI